MHETKNVAIPILLIYGMAMNADNLSAMICHTRNTMNLFSISGRIHNQSSMASGLENS